MSPPPRAEVATKTILVVEDETPLRALVSVVLKRQGFRVISAADGIEGSMLLARSLDSIDLLLTDVSLPGMRGPDLARYARHLRSDLKVLFTSGSIQFEDHDTVNFLKGTGLLVKPFTVEDLTRAVATIFEPRLLNDSGHERARSAVYLPGYSCSFASPVSF